MFRSALAPALLALIALAPAGCSKLRADRDREVALDRARAAIDAYSKASSEANAAHARVLAAFRAANAASSLADYRKSMREQVLPRMAEFVGRLEGMQTGTEELRRIHRLLVAGYRDALGEIGRFVDELEEPSDLARFPPIRARLQARVRHYRHELGVYYSTRGRRLDGRGSEVGPASAPEAATPS